MKARGYSCLSVKHCECQNCSKAKIQIFFFYNLIFKYCGISRGLIGSLSASASHLSALIFSQPKNTLIKQFYPMDIHGTFWKQIKIPWMCIFYSEI